GGGRRDEGRMAAGGGTRAVRGRVGGQEGGSLAARGQGGRRQGEGRAAEARRRGERREAV
ncbi:MAG: hypothetical protein LBQ12_13105, partial [Deltaproteobacteria bacterium]|nr:hypothetical protein [Deltaproteobacteria bacterium]